SSMKRIALAAALSLFAASAFAAPVPYKLDPTHTDVIAQWSHFGFSNPSAHFRQADRTLVYDADDGAASSLEVTLPVSGLNAVVPALTRHRLAADVAGAAQCPTATFKSTSVEAAGERKPKVTGDLTMRGTTKPVVLDVTLNKAGV